jgi:hypothetical protein
MFLKLGEEYMKVSVSLLCIAFCLFVAVPQSKAAGCGLVTNCGFETGDFTGWTLSGNDVPGELNNLYGVEGTDPLDGIAPFAGSYQAFIGDLTSNATTLSQDLTTVTGATYTVSFWAAQDTTPTTQYGNELDASLGSGALDLSNVSIEGYTHYTFTDVATSTSTVLSLTVGNGLGEFLLDNIAVSETAPPPTPEPPAWMLLLTGMAGLGLLHKRALGMFAARPAAA